MRQLATIPAVVLFGFLAACSSDPASAVKLPPKVAVKSKIPEAKPVSVTFIPNQSDIDEQWFAETCPGQAGSASADFVATGPCPFQQAEPVSCEVQPDDVIIGLVHKGTHGDLAFYLNVENYHGPGEYGGTQVFLALQGKHSIFRWSNDEVHAIVGPDESFVQVRSATLVPEPSLLACSQMIGPQSNFQFQCSQRGGTHLMEGRPVTISGTLHCIRRNG